jgi:hypothetical protein
MPNIKMRKFFIREDKFCWEWTLNGEQKYEEHGNKNNSLFKKSVVMWIIWMKRGA